MKKDINIGLCILRIIMCFEVILIHVSVNSNNVILAHLDLLQMYAVPVFMLLAFFLTEPIISSNSVVQIKKRINRLVIPYITWGVIVYLIFLLDMLYLKTINVDTSNLIMQIFTGKGVHGVLWYLLILLLLTVLFFYVFFMFHNPIIIIWVLAILSLIIQYTGINYNFFSLFIPEISGSYGCFFEMLPYATIGISMSYFDIFDKLQKRRGTVIVFSTLIGVYLYISDILPQAKGFSNSGLMKIIIAILLVIIAYLFPFKWLPSEIRNLIIIVSKYTLGVYCIHTLVIHYLTYVAKYININPNTHLFAIITYGISLLLSVLISRLPFSYTKKLVM